MKSNLLVLTLVTFALVTAHAEMTDSTGVVPNSRLPAPINSESIVRLDVPHLRQLPYYCVPTSCAMILKYFGDIHEPAELKRLAEGYKPEAQRNKTFTYYTDMNHALQSLGKKWSIRNYPKTDAGYAQGLAEIKDSLRGGNPVMIDVHQGQGHTFVIMGFNEPEKVVYVRDPNLPEVQSRILPYDELLRSWHNHRFGDSRVAFFSRR